MRIEQAYVGVSFFKDGFLSKYNLFPYSDKKKPVVFFGCYRKHWPILLDHKSIALVVWAGSDSMQLINHPIMARRIRSSQNILHIAISKFISDDLKRLNIEHKLIPISPFSYSGFNPTPNGKCIYFYAPPAKLKFYGWQIIEQIKKSICYKIIHCGHTSYTREQLKSIYAQCFIGIRLTPHDGLSNTAIELGLMGKKIIWNGNTPNAIPYTNNQSIINAINNEAKKIGITDNSIADAVKKYIDIGDSWLNVNELSKQNIQPARYNATVIINTVNETPATLKRAILSYKNQQRLDNLQIIISTIAGDSSIPIGKDMGCDIVICPEKGIYQQLNYALKYVSNEWLSYASGNDTALPNKLFCEISTCIKRGKLICYSDYNLVVGPTITHRKFQRYNILTHIEANYVNDCATFNYRLLKRFLPFELKWGNHAFYDFWLRVFTKCGNVFAYYPYPTWNYIVTENSQHIKRSKSEIKKAKNKLLRIQLQTHHKNNLKKLMKI